MFRIFVRSCSRAATKAEAKISWNKDNKQLFGEVVKKVKKSRKAKCDPEIIAGKSEPEAVLSSEMHWMLGSTQKRTRMLAKPYDNTERIALNVPHPKEAKQQPTTSGFADILKVPLIYNTGSDAAHLMQIPELTDYTEVPSVGKILQATMSDGARNALIKWKLTKIEELGEEGFLKLQKENLSRGLRFHNLLQDYFTGVLPDDPQITETDVNFQVWKSVQAVLPEIEREALFVEHRVAHPVLQYKGVVDCVSAIGNEVYCIEWKNSEKAKSTISATFDAPLQLTAYLGALNANNRGENGEIKSGMVVVAYQNGRPADYYKLDEVLLQKYWHAWLLRVQEYWIRYRDGTLPDPIF